MTALPNPYANTAMSATHTLVCGLERREDGGGEQEVAQVVGPELELEPLLGLHGWRSHHTCGGEKTRAGWSSDGSRVGLGGCPGLRLPI